MHGSRKKPLPSSHMWSSLGGTASPVSRAKGQATFQQVRSFGHGKVDSPVRIRRYPHGFFSLPDRAVVLAVIP